MIEPDRTSTSPFFNPSPPSGQGVIIHATRSGTPMNPNELEGTLNWFKNPTAKVSAHWVIGRQGQMVRVVPDDRQAWHAGVHNGTHWGIELEQATSSEGFTEAQYDALEEVCWAYHMDFGVPLAHDMAGYIGHEETPQGKSAGKSDPGVHFDWSWLMEGLQQRRNPDHGNVPEPPMLEQLKFLVDLGYFITHEWDFTDMQPWQRDMLADWNRRANG